MARSQQAEVVEAAGREVRVTSPDKVFFPELGATKLDLVRYYLAVERADHAGDGRPAHAHAALPPRRRRPVVLPEAGARQRPDWLETTIVSTVNGTTSRALVAKDVAHLIWAVNLGCLGFHVWPYRSDPADDAGVGEVDEHGFRRDPTAEMPADHRVDELRIDLDPQPGTGFAEAVVAAGELRTLLDEHRHRRVPQDHRQPRRPRLRRGSSPGGRRYEVRAAAVAVARELERRRPDILTAAWWKEERGERIFVDYNQNAPHKTVFGAWSARSRVGGQVSTPVSWDELADGPPRRPDHRHRARPRGRATATRGPAMDDEPQSLEPLLAMSERDMANGLMDAPVAARLPEDAERAAPGGAQPGSRPRRRLRTGLTSAAVFITNHALAGAVIGSTVRRPALAFGLGVASHIGMDLVLHYGREGIDWDDFVELARVDGTLGLAVCAGALAATPRGRRRRSRAGIAGACLIDMDKPGRHFVGRSPFPAAVDRFHGRIQNESRIGGLIEAAVAVALAAALVQSVSRHR